MNDAREKVEANPRDAAAQLELANALQAEGQIQEAIVALERYTELRPNDTDGLQQLAVLWGTQAARARQDAEAAAAEAQEANLAGAFAQGDSPFVQTLYQTKISESISQLANARSTEAQSRALDASRSEADIYERLSTSCPTSPSSSSSSARRPSRRVTPRRRSPRGSGSWSSRRTMRAPAHPAAARAAQGRRQGRVKRLSCRRQAARGLMNFDIKTEELENDGYVIALSGEVDLYTAPEFKQQLLEVIGKGGKEVVVDLTETTFIDSTTLGVLVGGVKRLRPNGGQLSLVCSDRNITKIFEITGLNKVFPIYESRDEAVGNIAQESQPPA